MFKKLFEKGTEVGKRSYKETIDYANLQFDKMNEITMKRVEELNKMIIEMQKG